MKEHLNIVFIGHVDAGKSTIGGNLLYLTGMIDQRTIEKYRREAKDAGRESWYLSWALDTNKEERSKGITVDVGQAHFETAARRYTILDAPGHKMYISNMICGAAQADVAVLVISARRGEFETGFERGGQTGEHAILAKTSGIKKLIVAINKMDDLTVNWDQGRYEECKAKLLPYLKQCGFNSKKDLEFIPISGYSGANLKERVSTQVCSYYNGPTLLELLDSIPLSRNQSSDRDFLMPVTSRYKDMGIVTVTGKIEVGSIQIGDNMRILPNKVFCQVVTMLLESEEQVTSAQSGDMVQIRLKGVEEEDIPNGSVLCSVDSEIPVTSTFEAQLIFLETKSIVTAGYTAVLHVHNTIVEMTLDSLLHTVDRKTGKRTKKPPQFVKKGDMCIARIVTSQPIVIDTSHLGRITIRSDDITVAVGKVTKTV